jgi:hypothetical protein
LKTLTHIVDDLHRTGARAEWAGRLVTAAIAVWVGTSVLALGTGSAEFFSRAGAVGTGLVLTSFALASTIRQTYHNHLLKGLVLVMRGELKGTPPESETTYDHNLEAIGRLFARLERKSGSARLVEVEAALLTTLQWGYGDLLVNRILGCGAWRC